MADMSKRNDSTLSVEEIDRLVETEDDSAWEEAVHVQPPQTRSVPSSFPPRLRGTVARRR
jgi:hypothetical protein